MRAIWHGTTIAESDDTIVVEGNHYFPRASVHAEYLVPSDTTSHCHWKGDAAYHSIQVDGDVNQDAAWYYAEPLPEAANITDHVAFWRGVEVS